MVELNNEADEKSPLLSSTRGLVTSGSSLVNSSVGGSLSVPSVVEPPDQFKSRWRSIRIMYLTMFLSAVTFTITMSTIWPYLQVVDKTATPSLLGWVVAAYSLGQLVASPVFGFWSARRLSAREPLAVSLFLQVFANFFYAYVPSMPGNGGVYLAVARSLMGFASGNAAVVRAYVSGATTLSERTAAMANVSLFQSVGFILGPVIQTALVFIGYPGPVEAKGFHFNMYTTPAFLSATVAVVNLVLLIVVFKEHTVQEMSRLNINDDDDNDVRNTELVAAANDKGPPDYVAVFTTMYLFFIVFFVFTIFETISTPLVMDMYGWSKKQAALYVGILLAAAGVLAIFVFVVVKLLSRRFDDRILLISGYIFCFVGFFIYLPWGHQLPVRGYAPLYPPIPVTPPVNITQESPHSTHVVASLLLNHDIIHPLHKDSSVSKDPTATTNVIQIPPPVLTTAAPKVLNKRTAAPVSVGTKTSGSPTTIGTTAEVKTTGISTSAQNATNVTRSGPHSTYYISIAGPNSTTKTTTTGANTTYITRAGPNSTDVTTVGLNITTVTTSAQNSTEMTTSSHNSTEMTTEHTTSGHNSTEITTEVTTEVTTETTTSSHNSTEVTTEMTTSCHNSTEATTSHNSTEVTTYIHNSTEISETTSSRNSTEITTAPLTTAGPNFTEITTGSNVSNVTVPPEGCPWNFGWCGLVPRVQLAQFLVGTAAIAVGYPVCNVMTYTLYSKVLGPQPQGLWMGFLTATGSLARTLGPIFVSQVYDAWGPRVTFATSCAILLVTILGSVAAYRRLLPFATSPFRRREPARVINVNE